MCVCVVKPHPICEMNGWFGKKVVPGSHGPFAGTMRVLSKTSAVRCVRTRWFLTSCLWLRWEESGKAMTQLFLLQSPWIFVCSIQCDVSILHQWSTENRQVQWRSEKHGERTHGCLSTDSVQHWYHRVFQRSDKHQVSLYNSVGQQKCFFSFCSWPVYPRTKRTFSSQNWFWKEGVHLAPGYAGDRDWISPPSRSSLTACLFFEIGWK